MDAAARQPGATAAAAAQGKRAKYGPHLPPSTTFIPAVVESFGAWGDDMVALWDHIRQMARMAGQLEGDDYAEHRLARQWLPALAVGLQRSNALAVIHRARRDRVAAGRSAGGRPSYFEDMSIDDIGY